MSVRWDTVVDRAAVEFDKTPSSLPRCASVGRTGRVHVQLFGALAATGTERSIRLDLPVTTTVAGVLAALARRIGEPFLARVLDETGKKHRYCRLFVDGNPVEDIQTPLLDMTAESIQIEIILLMALEGG